SAHYDLGRLLVSQRKYVEAATILERGAELNRSDPSTRYQLFLAYSRSKQKEKAEKALAEFKRLEAEFSGAGNLSEQNQNLPDKLENLKP
ncbi:MAG: hypothetical protein M3Q99_01750, partial [Acidobacteriota bacterium]|nr:hypothetical protein [Acidobacteriota bacterium]